MSIGINKRIIMDKVDKRLFKHTLSHNERGKIKSFVFGDTFRKGMSFQDILREIMPRDFTFIFKNKMRKKAWGETREHLKKVASSKGEVNVAS